MVNFSLLSRYFAFTTFLLLFRFVLFCLFIFAQFRPCDIPKFSCVLLLFSLYKLCIQMHVRNRKLYDYIVWIREKTKGKAKSWIVFQKQGLNENIVCYMVCKRVKWFPVTCKLTFAACSLHWKNALLINPVNHQLPPRCQIEVVPVTTPHEKLDMKTLI